MPRLQDIDFEDARSNADDGDDAQQMYYVKATTAEESPDPRYKLEVALTELSYMYCTHPARPADPTDLSKPISSGLAEMWCRRGQQALRFSTLAMAMRV